MEYMNQAVATWKLYPELLVAAYSQGYFPMPHPDSGEILWLRPDPRAVLPLEGMHVSRSLRRTLNRASFEVTFDKAFQKVMLGCARRPEGTWILPEFFVAYHAMYRRGLAHSVEVWHGGELTGGLYGVSLGGAFFAESKFHTVTDASKVALYHLVEHLRKNGFLLLEVQFLTAHLKTLGCTEIPDAIYQQRLKDALRVRTSF